MFSSLSDSQRFWFRVFFYGWVPALLAGGYYNIILNPEDHDPPEFTKLPYLRIRPKRGLPYGDGNHNLIFNPHVNPLPDGFEEGYGGPVHHH